MRAVWAESVLYTPLACLATLMWSMAALAGPPYLTDDPVPTDYRKFEIYGFADGTGNSGGTATDLGVDFNYGGAPDLQLTAVLPIVVERPRGETSSTGLGNVQLAAKYRFLHQRESGWDVAIFPRLFLPSGSPRVGERHAYVQLPLWVGRDWGKWSTFGGGGLEINHAGNSRDSGFAGWVLAHQILPTLQAGVEIFHRTADAVGALDTTVLGVGVRYDLNRRAHLLAYTSRGIHNAESEHRYSWYAAMLFTF